MEVAGPQEVQERMVPDEAEDVRGGQMLWVLSISQCMELGFILNAMEHSKGRNEKVF